MSVIQFKSDSHIRTYLLRIPYDRKTKNLLETSNLEYQKFTGEYSIRYIKIISVFINLNSK